MSRSNSEPKWREIIRTQINSGIGAQKWCEQNGIIYSTYKYWVKRFKKLDGESADWAKVSISAEMSNLNPDAKSVRENFFTVSIKEFSVKVPPEFDKQSLAELLEILLQVC